MQQRPPSSSGALQPCLDLAAGLRLRNSGPPCLSEMSFSGLGSTCRVRALPCCGVAPQHIMSYHGTSYRSILRHII